MAVQSPPFALQNSSAHSAALFRQAAFSPWLGGGVVAPGEYAVTAQGTPNMSVVVAGGRAWIAGTQVASVSGQAFSTQAGYFGLNDAPATVTIAAANATNPRIDLVYVAVQDSFYSGATNALVVGVITGTPAASPVAPSAPSNALTLATVAVAANATSITNGNIAQTPTASLLAIPRGGVDPVLSTARPTTGLYPGYPIYETDTGNFSVWAGSAWVPVTGTAGDAAITLGSGWANLAGGYAALQSFQIGNLVVIYGAVTNNSSYSTGPQTVATIPTALRPAKNVMVHGGVESTGTALQSARFDVGSSGSLLVYPPAAATIAANSFHTLTAVYNINNV